MTRWGKRMNFTTIKIEQRGQVAWVILNRPEVRNAFNNVMIAEIAEAFRDINQSYGARGSQQAVTPNSTGGMLPDSGEAGRGKHVDALRVVVVTGEGAAFCAGADLKWMGGVLKYSYEENLEDSLKLAEMFHLMFTCPLPTIARVNGPAIGGGCGIAAVCDIVIASEQAVFSLSEVKLGLVPACISPYVIRRMGDKNCREFFLTGERLTAQKALAAGLANQVVPPEKLNNAVNSRVEQLLSSGPNALAMCKELLEKAPDVPEPDVGKYTAEIIARLRMGDEGQEGMKAFFEKRKPKWAE
jgi:methylglutaconyl-CoA hydratase